MQQVESTQVHEKGRPPGDDSPRTSSTSPVDEARSSGLDNPVGPVSIGRKLSEEDSMWAAAKKARRRARDGRCGACFSFTGMFFWIFVIVTLGSILWSTSDTSHAEKRLAQGVVFDRADRDRDCPSFNLTCAVAQRSVWRQFTNIINGVQSDDAAPRASACDEEIAKSSAEGHQVSASTCSNCMCEALHTISSSSTMQECGVSSVLGAMSDQQSRLEAAQQAHDRFSRLKNMGNELTLLDTERCNGCDEAQCTMGRAMRSTQKTGNCDSASCAAICTRVADHFTTNVSSACDPTEIDQLSSQYRDLQPCVTCCTSTIPGAGCSFQPDATLPGCAESCPSAACSELADLYASLSRKYNECPDQLPPGLRVAMAHGSMSAVITSQFQDPRSTLNITDLGMPPETRECVNNLTQRFPKPTTNANSDSSCFNDVEATRDMMNEFLQIIHRFARQKNKHVSFVILVVVALLMLAFRIRVEFEYASQAVRMTPQEERHYAMSHRNVKGVLDDTAWEDSDDPKLGLKLAMDWSMHISQFVPVYHDWFRARRNFISNQGGNLATIDELKTLSHHPEVHVLGSSSGAANDGERDELSSHAVSPQAQAVLESGSTAINFLVWRRSMLRVCYLVLALSMCFQLSALKTSVQEARLIGAPTGDDERSSDIDPVEVVVGYFNKVCHTTCLVQEKVHANPLASTTEVCDQLCEQLSAGIGANKQNAGLCTDAQTSQQLSPVPGSEANTRAATMEKKYGWYHVISSFGKVLMTAHALHEYRMAEKCWHDVRQSSTFVGRGWIMLFLLPMIISLVPWFNVLDFDAEYEDALPIDVFAGSLKGFNFKGKLGMVTYLNTFSIGLAYCQSAIRASVQCKLLIPCSSLWSRSFAVIPVFAVVLQWPLFALIGTMVSANGLWAFVLVFTINPLVFLAFSRANIMQQANTPVKAHRVISHAKTINLYLYLMALCFLLVDCQRVVAEWLQKICLSQDIATSDTHSWQWPWPCVPNMLLSPSVLGIDASTVMMGLQLVFRYSVGYMVSYFVTVLALVDQLLINVFMLWEHDGYMADDRDVHALSFLYAKSLYDIRNRSESMLSASKTFLATDRSRIDWILQLERLKAAFDIYDTSGDGSIQRQELEHVLARLTFDGGTGDGRSCRCKTCTEWSQCTTVTRVDWNAFRRQFEVLDDDNSGELEFPEFVALAIGSQRLSEAQLADVEALEHVIVESAGTAHNPMLYSECPCRACALRRLGGQSDSLVSQAPDAQSLLRVSRRSRSSTLENVQNPASSQ